MSTRTKILALLCAGGLLCGMTCIRECLEHPELCAPRPTPTSTPEPTPTPAPRATPTPSPTPISTPTPTPIPNATPKACACVVIWAGGVFINVDSNHQPVSVPTNGGWTTIDTTLRFSRSTGDGRGQPCDTPDRIQEVCGGRNCEPDNTSPNFQYSGPNVRQVIDGFQLRLGPLAPGHYRIQVVLPPGTRSPSGDILAYCPWGHGPTVNDIVEFDVD